MTKRRHRQRRRRRREERRLYWAYGSNLCVADMQRRCPKAEQYRRLYVNNGLLVFRGVADVESSSRRDDVVAGGLWWITRECEEALDRYEGNRGDASVFNSKPWRWHQNAGLYVKAFLTLEVDGEKMPCLFYKMTSHGVMPPWESYLETIVEGYRDFGLPLSYLDQAVMRSWSQKDRTPDLTRRWVAKGQPSLARALRGDL